MAAVSAGQRGEGPKGDGVMGEAIGTVVLPMGLRCCILGIVALESVSLLG
jgi:hypothetical protein